MTAAPVWRAARFAAPVAGWRSTMASTPRRSRVTTVSMRDSPLAIAEPLSESKITSAPPRRAACSKETAVRVEASKKARHTVFPTSGLPRRPSAWARARSRIARRSSHLTSSSVRKFLVSNDDHHILPVRLGQVYQHPLLTGRGQVFPDVISPDGQLPVPPIHQDREPDSGGAAELKERVHRRPRRPASKEHIINQDDRASRDHEGHVAALYFGFIVRQVVPVQRDVQRAHRDIELLEQPDVLRDGRASGTPRVSTPTSASSSRLVAFLSR